MEVTRTVSNLQMSENAIELVEKSIIAMADRHSTRDKGCITVRSGEEAIDVVAWLGLRGGGTAWEASARSTTMTSRMMTVRET
jgi:hypothetical protein